MFGDVNDSLDYHLWALALSMGLRYKPRPMHTPGGYDVSSFYSLRQVGEIMAAPAGSPPAITTRYAQVKMLLRPAVHQMCEAFDIVVPDGSDCQGGIALTVLEDRLSASTPAADTFWRALGDGAGRNARISSACMAVVRGLVAHAAPPAPAPPPAPASAAAPTTAQMFGIMFSGFVGPELASSKMLTLQILYPENVLYKNELAVGAGAYDDAIKRWIGSTPDLAAALPSAPLACTGALLRTVVAVRGSDDSGGGGGGSRPSSTSAGAAVAAAARATSASWRRPSTRPSCPRPRAKTGTLASCRFRRACCRPRKRSCWSTSVRSWSAAVALGQTPAGSEACANLGVTRDVARPRHRGNHAEAPLRPAA